MPLEQITTKTIEKMTILQPDGSVDAALDPHLTDEESLKLYRAMLLARVADERLLKLQRQGRIGTFAPSTGQEAAVCGPVMAMSDKDWLVPAFRELGAQLMRGVPFENVLLYYNGWEEGNVTDAPRTLPNSVPVASQDLHAVGLAYAMQYKGEENAGAVVFCGDGGTSEGDFYEALNFAGVWKVPVVFVVQNNGWAISIPRSKQTAAETLAQKAVAAGIYGLQVDGNDALAMYVATKQALERGYRGEGPTVIEAITYRLQMHTTADDPKKYRTDDEVTPWLEKEPLLRFARYLRARGLLDDARQTQLEEEAKQEVERAVKAFEAKGGFAMDTPFDHVYGTPHPSLDEQRREFLQTLSAS